MNPDQTASFLGAVWSGFILFLGSSPFWEQSDLGPYYFLGAVKSGSILFLGSSPFMEAV